MPLYGIFMSCDLQKYFADLADAGCVSKWCMRKRRSNGDGKKEFTDNAKAELARSRR